MNKVYRVVDDAGRTEALGAVRCANEANELRNLLEANLDFVPGDQINPEDPCRWLTFGPSPLNPHAQGIEAFLRRLGAECTDSSK